MTALPFTLRVTSAVGARSFAGSVNTMSPTVVATALATGNQQTISDSTGQYSITLDAGLSPPGTRFSIVMANDSLGRRSIGVRVEGPLNAAGGVAVSVPQNQSTVVAQWAPGSSRARIATVSISALPSAEDLCGKQGESDVAHLWWRRESEYANFGKPYGRLPEESQSLYRVGREYLGGGVPSNGSNGSQLSYQDTDAVLCAGSLAGLPSDTEPVLFIHGFTLEALGPLGAAPNGTSNATFGNLLHLLNEPAETSPVLVGRRLKPFLFRWRTNQRFEDAARALRQAVELIKSRTGRDVHIIAHSFGGVLTRVYLQGLATGEPGYDTPVASVTSFGAPYSGIFPDSSGTGFPWGLTGMAVFSAVAALRPRVAADLISVAANCRAFSWATHLKSTRSSMLDPPEQHDRRVDCPSPARWRKPTVCAKEWLSISFVHRSQNVQCK